MGVGPHSIIQNLNFITSGLLVGLFAFSIEANLPASGNGSKSNVVLSIQVASVGIINAGVTLVLWASFPNDYFFFWIHTAMTFIGFFAFSAAQIFTWRALRSNPSWGRYPKLSLVCGVLTLTAIFVFILSLGTSFHGVTERLVVAVPFVWLAATGIKFYTKRVVVAK